MSSHTSSVNDNKKSQAWEKYFAKDECTVYLNRSSICFHLNQCEPIPYVISRTSLSISVRDLGNRLVIGSYVFLCVRLLYVRVGMSIHNRVRSSRICSCGYVSYIFVCVNHVHVHVRTSRICLYAYLFYIFVWCTCHTCSFVYILSMFVYVRLLHILVHTFSLCTTSEFDSISVIDIDLRRFIALHANFQVFKKFAYFPSLKQPPLRPCLCPLTSHSLAPWCCRRGLGTNKEKCSCLSATNEFVKIVPVIKGNS